MARRGNGEPIVPALPSPWQRLHHVAPGLLAVALFVVVGLWDLARGLDLWMWYSFVGAGLGAIIVAWLHVADARVPHYVWGIVSIGLLLHYAGGSLGQPDPGDRSWFGIRGVNGAYHTFPWWDHLTHLVGIGAAGVGFAYLVDVAMMRKGVVLPAWFVFAFGTVAGLAAGVGVELYEFAGRSWFQTIDQGGYANTLSDLVWNVVGAVLGAAVATAANKRFLRRDLEGRWLREARPARLLGVGAIRVSPGVGFTLVLSAVMTAGSLIDLGQYALNGAPPKDSPEDLAAYDEALSRLTRFTFYAFAIAGAFLLATVVFGLWRLHRPAGHAEAPDE